jgi:hypothetical protein
MTWPCMYLYSSTVTVTVLDPPSIIAAPCGPSVYNIIPVVVCVISGLPSARLSPESSRLLSYLCICIARYRTCVLRVWPLCQSSPFELYLREPKDLRRRTEIIPVKDSHTRIKPLALASGHGRYITVTPERTLHISGFIQVGPLLKLLNVL